MSIEIHLWMAITGQFLIVAAVLILCFNRTAIHSYLLNLMIRELFETKKKKEDFR